MEGTIGEIRMFGGNFAPRNLALCEGQLLSTSSFSSLFAILGTIYGGDGRTTFGLPDMRGRAAVGVGQGPGLQNITQGQKVGVETVTLTEAQMPSHTHTATSVANASSAAGAAAKPAGNLWAGGSAATTIYNAPGAGTAAMAGDAVTTSNANTGGGQPIDNRSPEIAVQFIICLEGLFPSRS